MTTTKEAKDRIWAMFAAPETPTLDEQIDEVLQLTAERVNRILRAVPPPCAESGVCERVHGHDGLHRLGPLEWASR